MKPFFETVLEIPYRRIDLFMSRFCETVLEMSYRRIDLFCASLGNRSFFYFETVLEIPYRRIVVFHESSPVRYFIKPINELGSLGISEA